MWFSNKINCSRINCIKYSFLMLVTIITGRGIAKQTPNKFNTIHFWHFYITYHYIRFKLKYFISGPKDLPPWLQLLYLDLKYPCLLFPWQRRNHHYCTFIFFNHFLIPPQQYEKFQSNIKHSTTLLFLYTDGATYLYLVLFCLCTQNVQ